MKKAKRRATKMQTSPTSATKPNKPKPTHLDESEVLSESFDLAETTLIQATAKVSPEALLQLLLMSNPWWFCDAARKADFKTGEHGPANATKLLKNLKRPQLQSITLTMELQNFEPNDVETELLFSTLEVNPRPFRRQTRLKLITKNKKRVRNIYNKYEYTNNNAYTPPIVTGKQIGRAHV